MTEKKVNQEALKRAFGAAEGLTNKFVNELLNEVMKHAKEANAPEFLPIIAGKVAGTIVLSLTGVAALIAGHKGQKFMDVMNKVCPDVLESAAASIKEAIDEGRVVMMELDEMNVQPTTDTPQ